jgi:predicted ABC-type ATPase
VNGFAFPLERPIIVALAGPNGAGKSTFYNAHLKSAGLPFLNADETARLLGVDAYEAAKIIADMRNNLFSRRESFIFETVLSDPVGDKIAFLRAAAESDYTVVLIFIGICLPALSEQRVGMRVAQGEHDVPLEKIRSRFPRTLANLKLALEQLPFVIVYDNTDLMHPYEKIALFENGKAVFLKTPVPRWFRPLLPCTGV